MSVDVDITEQVMGDAPQSDLNIGKGMVVEIPDSPMRIFEDPKRIVGVVVFQYWRHLDWWWDVAQGILSEEIDKRVRGPKSREGHLVLMSIEAAESGEPENIRQDTLRLRKIVAVGRGLVYYESYLRDSLAPVLPIQKDAVESSPRWALSRIVLQGFRGFTHSVVDLSAGAVIITGTNGSGKSALADGAFWALTGEHLRGDAGELRNLYAATGPEVRVELVDHHGDTMFVTRRHHPAGGCVEVEHGDRRETGHDAQALVASLLWPPSQHALDPHRSFVGYLTTCVFPSRDGKVRLPTTDQDERDIYQLLGEITGSSANKPERNECDLPEVTQLIQDINNALGTHPDFTNPRFLTRFNTEPRQSLLAVDHSATTNRELAPQSVLSHSQQKKLALATAIGLNLATSQGLGAIILDDPFPSLDVVSALSLCEVLRNVRHRRQIVISTHDNRYGNLLERKMRPMGAEQTLSIRMGHWGRNGPRLTSRKLQTASEELVYAC